MSCIRRAFTSNANVVVLDIRSECISDTRHNICPLFMSKNENEMQSQAVIANLRTCKPASQFWKLVPTTIFRGQVDPSAERGRTRCFLWTSSATSVGRTPRFPPLRSATAAVGTSAPPAFRGCGRLSARGAMIFSAKWTSWFRSTWPSELAAPSSR